MTQFGHIGVPTRTEKLQFNLELDYAQSTRHHDNVKVVMGGNMPVVSDGDTLRVKYDVHCQYFGEVVERLTAIREILTDPSVIFKAELGELEHGESLIVSVVDRLREVQAAIAARKQ